MQSQGNLNTSPLPGMPSLSFFHLNKQRLYLTMKNLKLWAGDVVQLVEFLYIFLEAPKFHLRQHINQMWCCTPAIPALGRKRPQIRRSRSCMVTLSPASHMWHRILYFSYLLKRQLPELNVSSSLLSESVVNTQVFLSVLPAIHSVQSPLLLLHSLLIYTRLFFPPSANMPHDILFLFSESVSKLAIGMCYVWFGPCFDIGRNKRKWFKK